MGTDHERFIIRLIKSSNKDEILQVILITDSNGGPSQVMMGCCDRYSFKNLDFAIEFLKRKLMEGFFFKEVKSFIEYL